MIRQTRVCDHCGDACGNKYTITLYKPFARKESQFIGDEVDGCTREHTVLAMAKILGIGIDGKATELLATKDQSIEDLKSHAATITGLANQYKIERDSLEETCRMHSARVIELERRNDAATLEEHRLGNDLTILRGQVATDKQRITELEKQRDELLANPVMQTSTNTPINFEFYFGDLQIPGHVSSDALERIIEDSVKRQIEAHAERLERIASITDTTKPTKPSQAIDNCEAYIEARTDYRRVAGGTFAEMHKFWDDNVDDFRRGERLIGANGDIIESMDQ